MIRWSAFVFASAFLLLTLSLDVHAQSQPITAGAIEGPEAAAQRVRTLQYSRDFEWAARLGARLVERYPDHRPLRAWHLVSKARADEADAAATEAEQMAGRHPENPWSYFALAGALNWLNWHDERGKEALAAIDEALARAPEHPDLLWLKAEVLVGRYRRFAREKINAQHERGVYDTEQEYEESLEGYEFPVLLDEGYVRENGVEAFPTTWFVGPDGRIHFVKRGWSKKLVEEFTWRIEALRAGR